MKSTILTLAALAAIAFAATPALADHARQPQRVVTQRQFVQPYGPQFYGNPYATRTFIYQGGFAPGCGVGGHYHQHPGYIDYRAGYYRSYNPGYIGIQTRNFSFRLGY